MFKHILVAIAEAADEQSTLATVTSLANAFTSEVTIFHARERIIGPRQTAEQETVEESRAYGHRIAEQLNAEGVSTGLVIEDSRPDRLVDHILAHADAENVDLIVIGGHHAHSLRESIFGDMGKALAHRAHCPILFMPSAE